MILAIIIQSEWDNTAPTFVVLMRLVIQVWVISALTFTCKVYKMFKNPA